MPDPYVLLDAGALEGVGAGTVVALDPETDRHLRRVLRLDAGAPLTVGDGAGALAPGHLQREGIALDGEAVHEPRARPLLHVVHALPKGRKLDEVVRTLTELGVDRITPVGSGRSVVRLEGDRATRAQQRWDAVARSAVMQSRRAWVPRIDVPAPLEEVVAGLGPVRGVVAHVGASAPLRSVADLLAELADVGDVVVLAVGPEGGWTDGEVGGLAAAGLEGVSLGPTVLRTEHAAVVLTTLVCYLAGRIG